MGALEHFCGACGCVSYRIALLDPLGGWHRLVVLPTLLALSLLGLLGHVHGHRLAHLWSLQRDLSAFSKVRPYLVVVVILMALLDVGHFALGDVVVATRTAAVLSTLEQAWKNNTSTVEPLYEHQFGIIDSMNIGLLASSD